MKRGVAGLSIAASVFTGLGAYFVFPIFFFPGSFEPTTLDAEEVLLIQEGSTGGQLDVAVESPRLNEGAPSLVLEEISLGTPSDAHLRIYVGMRTHVGGFVYDHEALPCQSDEDTTNPVATTQSSPRPALERAFAEGAITAVPDGTGDVTVLHFPESHDKIRVVCDLPAQFAFQQESISQWRVQLPGVARYGTAGGETPMLSYSIDREPSDFLVNASQPPSLIFHNSFDWWQRHFEYLALQGLFVTVSSPGLQQEHSYRLFIAGALLGLAGSFFVSGLLGLIEGPTRTP